MFESLGKLVLYLLGDSTSYTKMIRNAVRDFTDATSKIKLAGNQLTQSISKPLLDIGIQATTMSMEFQRSMAIIEGLVGIARKQVQAWSKDLIALAPQFAKDPVELAKGLYFITSAGFKGADAMEVLKASSMGAAAGLGSVKEVAFAAVSALNAYKYAGYTAVQAIDMITAAAREGHMEAADLARVIGNTLPLAAAMKLPLSDLLAGVASLTKLGASPSQAIIGIQGILKNFLKPTVAARKALEGVGLTFEQLRDMIKKPGGILEALKLLSDAMDKEGDIGGGVADIFGEIRPLRAALSLLVQDSQSVKDVFDAVAKSTGSTQAAFDAMSKTSGFKLDQMLTQIKVTLTDIGDIFSEILAPVFDQVSEGIQTLKGFWDSIDPTVQKFIGYVALAATAIGPLLVAFGSLSFIVPFLASAFASISLAIGGIASMGGPVILLIATLGIGIAIFVQKAGGIKAVWDKAQKAVDEFYKKYKPIIDAIIVLVEGMWNRHKAAVEAILKFWYDGMVAWYELVAWVWNEVVNAALNALKAISGKSNLTWKQVIDHVATAIYFMEYAMENFKQIMEAVWAVLRYELIAFLASTIHYMKYVGELATWFQNHWVLVFKTIYKVGREVFKDLFSGLNKQNLQKLLAGELSVEDIFKDSWGEIQKAIKLLGAEIPSLTERAVSDGEKKALENAKSKTDAVKKSFYNWLKGKRKGIPGAEEEAAAAKKQGETVARHYKDALKREFNTIDAALTFSAEGYKRIREYFAMLNGEGIGKGIKRQNVNPNGPKPLDKKPILNFDMRDRRVAGTKEDQANEYLKQIRDALVKTNKDKDKNIGVLPLELEA